MNACIKSCVYVALTGSLEGLDVGCGRRIVSAHGAGRTEFLVTQTGNSAEAAGLGAGQEVRFRFVGIWGDSYMYILEALCEAVYVQVWGSGERAGLGTYVRIGSLQTEFWCWEVLILTSKIPSFGDGSASVNSKPFIIQKLIFLFSGKTRPCLFFQLVFGTFYFLFTQSKIYIYWLC